MYVKLLTRTLFQVDSYNITVKNTGITIENANIVPWGNGDSSDLDADIDL